MLVNDPMVPVEDSIMLVHHPILPVDYPVMLVDNPVMPVDELVMPVNDPIGDPAEFFSNITDDILVDKSRTSFGDNVLMLMGHEMASLPEGIDPMSILEELLGGMPCPAHPGQEAAHCRLCITEPMGIFAKLPRVPDCSGVNLLLF
jgi:hypothetical protein